MNSKMIVAAIQRDDCEVVLDSEAMAFCSLICVYLAQAHVLRNSSKVVGGCELTHVLGAGLWWVELVSVEEQFVLMHKKPWHCCGRVCMKFASSGKCRFLAMCCCL
jgi:hypothetical protein